MQLNSAGKRNESQRRNPQAACEEAAHAAASSPRVRRDLATARPSTPQLDVRAVAHPVNDEEVARLISEAAQFDTTADQADAITFSAWDFGGQRVFYALHHAFLSRYGCRANGHSTAYRCQFHTKVHRSEVPQGQVFSKKIIAFHKAHKILVLAEVPNGSFPNDLQKK